MQAGRASRGGGRGEFWFAVAALAGWVLTAVFGLPLMFSGARSWPAGVEWAVVGGMVTGLVLVVTGELLRRI